MYDPLEKKTPYELRAILREIGASKPGNYSQQALIRQIRAQFELRPELEEKYIPPFVQQPEELEAVKAPVPFVTPLTPEVIKLGGCSEQQVRDAVKHCIAKGMAVKFIDNSWEFKYLDRTDAGTMAQPVETIARCANQLCKDGIVSANRMFLKRVPGEV